MIWGYHYFRKHPYETGAQQSFNLFMLRSLESLESLDQAHDVQLCVRRKANIAVTISLVGYRSFINIKFCKSPIAKVTVVVGATKQTSSSTWICLRLCFSFYYGKSPLNHHLDEYVFTLSKHFKQIQGNKLDIRKADVSKVSNFQMA